MTDWFEYENGIIHMLWPLQSSDLNPVEKLFERISFGRMFIILVHIQRLVESISKCFEALYKFNFSMVDVLGLFLLF